MDRGTGPDWGSWGRLEALIARFDDYEISARLGGPMTPHRDGMILQDIDFEGGIQGWSLTAAGTGAKAARSVAYARVGSCSLLLQTADGVGDKATAEKAWGFPNSGKVGIEFSWSGNGVRLRLHLKIRHYQNSRIRRYGIRLNLDADTYEYLLADDTWQAWLTDVPVYNALANWNVVKLVLDLDDDAYVRALVNGTDHALALAQSSVAGAIDANIVSVEMQVESLDTTNAAIYVDELVITDNER